jgi:Na+-transporting NADH:ubiquinone oxidoreductase subunit C
MMMSGKKKNNLNTNSNAYTIVYASIMVIIVAFMLAFAFKALAPRQNINVALDQKKCVLAALNIRNLTNKDAAATYDKVVKTDEIINESGNVVNPGSPGADKAGFKLNSADYKAGRLALYVCQLNGQRKYVIPVYGMGLWGPIWGYIAIDADKATVFGAYFNHESETAGLGAEIKDNAKWQEQFCQKKIFKPGSNAIALSVVKKADVTDPSTQCDAVTGATLTSKGVSEMLQEGLGKYKAFLIQK